MNPSYHFTAYLIYLPVVIVLTWYVAHILFRNSKVFMLDIFNGKAEIALATNRLFETGFYLLNLGFAFWVMEIVQAVDAPRTMLEILSTKIGGYCIYLGISLFFNLYLFFRGRRVSKEKARLAQAGVTVPNA
ncbi:hypothetical protein [Paraflavitalea pollutisoli]|uniref:hypothetical protein n=1 Tax=Paraflavitalea pollutisoli TaxID=3034143 RepID=UPI0023EBB668|nr:hypothetical protein [Paraflavitalea sp. H1-2-19X]